MRFGFANRVVALAVAGLGWATHARGADPSIDEQSEPRPLESSDRSPRNTVFLELLGNGLLYSVNYERFLWDSRVSLRAGFSAFDFTAQSTFVRIRTAGITSPWVVNLYLGGSEHRLQLGAVVQIS